LEQKLNYPAQLTFTLDGHAQEAPLLVELATDVVAFRWDETQGQDVVMFRGLLDHSEDQLSESSATVTFVAHDYLAMGSRRFFTGPLTGGWLGMDQDDMVYNLVAFFSYLTAADGVTSFRPGSFVPLFATNVKPDGTSRPTKSGQLRDRTWPPQTNFLDAITNLGAVINGFDFDVSAQGPSFSLDYVRVFYPQQGITRTDIALVYGVNVAALTRTVSSADYANYVREVGNKSSSDPNAPQMFAEAWNTDANNVTVNPVGLWMLGDNASDVSVQQTLNERAQGRLNLDGLLSPSYTLTLRPSSYLLGSPNMGDTVPLYVNEGRLNVNTNVRVVGIDYAIGDDGNEDVALTVGRAPRTLYTMLRASDRDIDALARR
jgi:hypothetical protein